MSAEGKLTVLYYVAKQDKLFTAAEVCSITGLERQLVYYHLNKFVEQGLIEKAGTNYCVLDRDKLVETIAFGANPMREKKARNSRIFKNADTLNEVIESCILAKTLTLAGSRELKERLNEEINQTISSLKNAKRGLNTRQISQKKARRNFNLPEYVKFCEHFDIEVDEKVLEIALGDRD